MGLQYLVDRPELSRNSSLQWIKNPINSEADCEYPIDFAGYLFYYTHKKVTRKLLTYEYN